MLSLIYICIIIVIIILIYIISHPFNLFTNNNITYIVNTSKDGFYSLLLNQIAHYYYYNKIKQNFKINLNNWIYKYNKGWTDYFEPCEIIFNTTTTVQEIDWHYKNENISINDIIKTIPNVYKYNKIVKSYINKIKNKFYLLNRKYASVYIRRGDKKVENDNIDELSYIKILLNKTNINILFVQTDDYNVYLNIKNFIQENNYNIELLTICKESSFGAITNNYWKELYLKKTLDEDKSKVDNIKPISEMTPNEKKEHALELLTGVDIVLHSDICITDYNSNVGRFIKYAHKNPQNVINVNNPNIDINYHKMIYPNEVNLY
jgi:hypothetical protein